MKLLIIHEVGSDNNNKTLSKLSAFLSRYNKVVEVNTTQLDELMTTSPEFDLSMSAGHELKLLSKYDLSYNHLSLNHSFIGPININNYPLSIRDKYYSDRMNRSLLLAPRYYSSIFEYEYDESVILTDNYYKYLEIVAPSNRNTPIYTTYYAHWTTKLSTIISHCKSNTSPGFRIRLHPLFFSARDLSNTHLLTNHGITHGDFMEFMNELTDDYIIDDKSLIDSILSTDRFIFDGVSSTFIEAMLIKYYHQPTSEYQYKLTEVDQVLPWLTEFDKNICHKYIRLIDHDYQGQWIDPRGIIKYLNPPSSLMQLYNGIHSDIISCIK